MLYSIQLYCTNVSLHRFIGLTFYALAVPPDILHKKETGEINVRSCASAPEITMHSVYF